MTGVVPYRRVSRVRRVDIACPTYAYFVNTRRYGTTRKWGKSTAREGQKERNA